MFGEIPATEYDLRFSLFGIPVRVHPFFWLTSAYLAWDRTDADLRRVIIRVLCIFLAILIHELGHAVVTRLFGWEPEIVLYFFGGYATTMRHGTWRDITVYAAGPAAGFSLYGLIWLAKAAIIEYQLIPQDPEIWFLLGDAIFFSLFINLMWNVMNLMPVQPLDGGQISRELFCRFNPRRGMEYSLLLSVIAGGGIAAFALQRAINDEALLGLEPVFLALLFGYLAFQSYQQYDQTRQRYW